MLSNKSNDNAGPHKPHINIIKSTLTKHFKLWKPQLDKSFPSYPHFSGQDTSSITWCSNQNYRWDIATKSTKCKTCTRFAHNGANVKHKS